MNFPARSAWTLPPGFQRLAPVSPNKVALLGYEWVRAPRNEELSRMCRRRLARAPALASAVGGQRVRDKRRASLAARRALRRAWRTPLTRRTDAMGRCAQVCAILVFTCVSNQRAGLWGPTFADCAACNGTTECTTGAGGPHGLGCGYLAFGQFQCAPAYAPARPRLQLLTRLHCCAARAPQAHVRRRHHVVDRHVSHPGARLHRPKPAAHDGALSLSRTKPLALPLRHCGSHACAVLACSRRTSALCAGVPDLCVLYGASRERHSGWLRGMRGRARGAGGQRLPGGALGDGGMRACPARVCEVAPLLTQPLWLRSGFRSFSALDCSPRATGHSRHGARCRRAPCCGCRTRHTALTRSQCLFCSLRGSLHR